MFRVVLAVPCFRPMCCPTFYPMFRVVLAVPCPSCPIPARMVRMALCGCGCGCGCGCAGVDRCTYLGIIAVTISFDIRTVCDVHIYNTHVPTYVRTHTYMHTYIHSWTCSREHIHTMASMIQQQVRHLILAFMSASRRHKCQN